MIKIVVIKITVTIAIIKNNNIIRIIKITDKEWLNN